MPLNLNDSKILEAVKWHAERTALFDLFGRAHQIVLKLPKFLLETPAERPDDQLEYQNVLVRAKFIALPLLREADIIDLLQSSFALAFELPNYDIWAKLKNKLISMPVFEERDVLRKKIREALLANDQVLTKENLVLDGKSVKGTVKNWLTDYHRTAGGAGEISALQLSQYLINSPNTKNLSAESRSSLDYLLRFYEKLKISSAELQGVEEQIIFNVEGELDIFKEGITERVGREEKETLKQLEGIEATSEIKDGLEARYEGSEEEIKKMEGEKNKIIKTSGGDFKKLSDLLFKITGVAPGKVSNKFQAEAVLKILAEWGKLEELLEERRFSEALIDYLKENKRIAELESFKLNPRAAEHVSAFLQYLLKERLGMSEDESGRIGMQLFNILVKSGKADKYRGLVYFDLETREFKWA